MRFPRFLSPVSLLAATVLLGGCQRDEAPTPLAADKVPETISQGFAGATGETKKLSDEVGSALKDNDSVTAWGVLGQMQERPDLTDPQREAATRAQRALIIKLQEAAAAGNAQAQQFVEAYRASK